jgi:histidine triad (HIT) family protein
VEEACVFCDIVAGRSPAKIVAEWDTAVAFFPVHPATLGHTLVVPRRHVRDIWSADAELGSHLLRYTLDLAHVLRSGLNPDGLNIINSSGEVATQTVMHLHVHLVPRYIDDAMGEIWPRKDSVTQEETEHAFRALMEKRPPAEH